MKDNIVLIGMPGAGKSTTGVILAKLIGYSFLDSDLVIQKKTGRLLRQIIEDEGVDGFIRIENEVNASLEVSDAVIATGGSVIYGAEAMQHLKEIGTVIYLKLSYNHIKSRLGNIKNRGVVLKPGQNLERLYLERVPLYEKYADITIEADNLSIEETIECITEALQKEGKING